VVTNLASPTTGLSSSWDIIYYLLTIGPILYYFPAASHDPSKFHGFDDPHTTKTKTGGGVVTPISATDYYSSSAHHASSPLRVCDRKAPIPHEEDTEMMIKYGSCPLMGDPMEETRILLLEGSETYGRTGNNLIEILHSLQYGRDNGYVVAIRFWSWATYVINQMWMAVVQDDIFAWTQFVEQSLCVKIVHTDNDLVGYKEVKVLDTRDLFVYQSREPLDGKVEYMGHILRTLYRSHNDGIGYTIQRRPVRNMCSVLDAIFGSERDSAAYSVVHSRSLEGEPGLRLLERIAKYSGCDPTAALDMEPDYVKAILGPLGMLEHPILFITDHQRPEILERLLEDPDIGPNIQLIPLDASWIGGDITAALMADVFIGNPASTFSGFIAKSRVALGYHDTTYMFRKKDDDGKWVDACSNTCIFDRKIMHAMS
jgi:hypothetical protein